MGETKQIQIVIVDDHRLVVDGLRMMIEHEPDLHICGVAENGKDALQLLSNQHADVVLMDINMPGLNGIETCKKLSETHPGLNILGLSMINETSLVKLMLKSGASGYILKNAGKDELLNAIRIVANGGKYICGNSIDVMAGVQQSPPARPFPPLSRREKEVLRLILEEFTTREIAEKLFVSFATVESHRHNLLAKLGVRNTAGLVRIALSYKLIDDGIMDV